MGVRSSKRLRTRDLFQPKASLWGENSRLFSGRESVLYSCLRSINVPGSATIIFGDQGVGKTSLAWQTYEILSGDSSTLERFDDLPSIEDEYIPIWIECQRRFENFNGVLLSLLKKTSEGKGNTLMDSFPDILSEENIKRRVNSTFELNVGIAKAKVSLDKEGDDGDGVKSAVAQIRERAMSDARELFSTCVEKVRNKNPGKELIIFFDEFDRVPDKTGVGDFIKHFSGAKFVFIGIAETGTDLISQHQSVERKLLGGQIYLPPLSSDEINGIFDIAQEIVSEHPDHRKITFNPAFRSSVVEDSGGYPSIAQFIGFQSVYLSKILEISKSKEVVIGKDVYINAAKTIFDPTSVDAQAHFNINLKDAIGRSPRRAEILAKLSEFPNEWVALTDLEANLSDTAQRDLNANIDQIAESDVLLRKRQNANEIKFTTPVLRFLVRIALKLRALPYYSNH